MNFIHQFGANIFILCNSIQIHFDSYLLKRIWSFTKYAALFSILCLYNVIFTILNKYSDLILVRWRIYFWAISLLADWSIWSSNIELKKKEICEKLQWHRVTYTKPIYLYLSKTQETRAVLYLRWVSMLTFWILSSNWKLKWM